MKRWIAFSLALALLLAAACAFAEINARDVMGVVEDGVYKNAYAGFGFSCEDWQVMTEEEIASVYDQSEHVLTEEFSKAMDRRDSLCFLMAKAAEGKDSIVGTITNEGTAAVLYHTLGFRTMYRMEAAKTRKNLESYGITVVSMDISTVTIDGREMPCLRIEETLDGVHVCSIAVSLVKGQYRIDFGASSTDFDGAEAILARFFWL